MQPDLILWADAAPNSPSYGPWMRIWHDLRRNAQIEPLDIALAGLMLATAIIVLTTRIDVSELDTQPPADLVGWTATIGICLMLVGRRRWPLRSIAAVVALIVVLGATANSDTVGFLALLIGLYSTAAHLPLRLALRAIAMVLVLVVVSIVVFDNEPTVGVIAAGVAFGLGRMIRSGRERQEHQASEAQRRAAVAIEIAELDAAADRQRMAQELHDVVAHSLSVIAVQAGIGAHLIDRVPAEAVRALDAIRTASNDAEGELARLIDVLRGGVGATDPAMAPSLDDVRALCARVGAAGVPIDVVTEGDLDAVPTGVSLAAYRIVQEALTNVVRHAGPATATVTVRVSPDQVDVCVEDDGVGVMRLESQGPRRVGHGLVGMTERAQMYGGDVVAGPLPGGGFRVRATLCTFAEPVGVVQSPTDRSSAAILPQSVDVSIRTLARRKSSLLAWDVALAVALAGFGVVELLDGRDNQVGTPAFTPTDGWAWLLKLGCCLLLIGRRRYPVSTLSGVTVLGVALTIGDYDTGIAVVALMIALYAVGSYATTMRLVGALLGFVVAMGVVAWSDPPDLTVAGAVWLATMGIAVAVAGYLVRIDRERRDATISGHEDAGAAQSRRARLAVTTERLRIAEELNSAITRSIHSIAIKAGSGSQIVDTDPAAALEMLESISVTSREALADLRRLLKRMRTIDQPSQYTPAALPAGTPRTEVAR